MACSILEAWRGQAPYWLCFLRISSAGACWVSRERLPCRCPLLMFLAALSQSDRWLEWDGESPLLFRLAWACCDLPDVCMGVAPEQDLSAGER